MFWRMIKLRMSFRSAGVMSCMTIMMIWAFYSMVSLSHPRWYQLPAPCVTPKELIGQMANLSFAVSDILDTFNIRHVLCYGTLWGALRLGQILPWDNNVNLCVTRNELDKEPLSILLAAFHSHKLEAEYDSRHGEIVIRNHSAICMISVFYEDSSQMLVRDGWEHRYFSFMIEMHQPFPVDIMKAPFPTLKFQGKVGMPVPHDDVEMLKYLYPDDWWMVNYSAAPILSTPLEGRLVSGTSVWLDSKDRTLIGALVFFFLLIFSVGLGLAIGFVLLYL